MSDPLNSERRAALRKRAEQSTESWDRGTKQRGRDELDLLAALETAEVERDRLREALDRAKAAECQAALSPPGQRRDDARGELRRVLEGAESE
jgi:hypothetical protein